MMTRARAEEALEAIASRPTLKASDPLGQDVYIYIGTDGFEVAATNLGPWVAVDVSSMTVRQRRGGLKFDFYTWEKHDTAKVQHLSLAFDRLQIASDMGSVNMVAALLEVRPTAPIGPQDASVVSAVERNTLVDILKIVKWQKRLIHFTEVAYREPRPRLPELIHNADRKVRNGMILVRWVSALDPATLERVAADEVKDIKEAGADRNSIRGAIRGVKIGVELGLLPEVAELRNVGPDPYLYVWEPELKPKDLELIPKIDELYACIRDPDSRGTLLNVLLECYSALQSQQQAGPQPSLGQMAALKWRQGFDAHRNAQLVCAAATDGDSVRLSELTKLGALAGALEAKCVSGPGQVASPYWTAWHRGHGSCVQVLFDQHVRMNVPIPPRPAWMGVPAPDAPGVGGAATGGAAAAGGQHPPILPGTQAAGPAPAGGQGAATAPASSSQDSSAEGDSSAPGGGS